MQIPAKIQHGEKVIATVFDKINGIIDYLNASRIRKGPGILVDESPSGTVIKLADNRPATPPQVLPAASGGASGIEAAVSGGTASITLTGGTGSVKMVGSGSVSISENGDGEIEFNSSGSAVIGFPDYSKFSSAEFISLVNQQVTKTYAFPIWLIGEAAKNTGSDMSCTITIDIGGKTINLLSVSIGSTSLYGYSVPVFIPIPANTTFTLTASGGFLSILNVYALPCL